MVLAGPRLLVVGTKMTARTRTVRQPAEVGQQDALFGDAAPAPARNDRDGVAVQDPELVADVVRTADGPGFLLIERSQRVVRADPAKPGVVDSAGRHEQDAVLQLLDSGHLRTGGTHHVHHHGHEGPARSILVPKATRDMVTRWSNLRRIPVQVRDSEPAPTPASKKRGRAEVKAVSGPIVVDVVWPGRGLLTCAEFGGQIIRDQGRYVVETEDGRIVARTASSYRAAALALARHHGYQPGPIEINRDEERDGNNPPRSARDRRLGL